MVIDLTAYRAIKNIEGHLEDIKKTLNQSLPRITRDLVIGRQELLKRQLEQLKERLYAPQLQERDSLREPSRAGSPKGSEEPSQTESHERG